MDLAQLKRAHVLVTGDAMLDRYWFGDAERISPEAPVPVVRVTRTEERLGGAANVARNIATVGKPDKASKNFCVQKASSLNSNSTQRLKPR